MDGLDSSDFSTTPETWKFACGENFFVDNQTGIPVPSGCAFYSYFDNPPDTISPFTPTPVTKTIEAINLLITTKSGSYSYPITLSLEVRDFSGNVKHTVSSSNVDFQTTPVGIWTSVPLSSNLDNLIIAPGEYLSVLVSRGGAPAGDLFGSYILEATVK
jgi:hypothetical protein